MILCLNFILQTLKRDQHIYKNVNFFIANRIPSVNKFIDLKFLSTTKNLGIKKKDKKRKRFKIKKNCIPFDKI